MNKTDNDAANAQTDTPSVSDVHDLRLTALLFDLVETRGRRGAAEVLGVSYGALARAADTGRLTGRMRDALTRHLLEGGKVVVDDGERDGLAELERRVSALEEDAEETPEGEETQGGELLRAVARIGEEQERLGRRISDLETYESTPPVVPAPHAASTEEHPPQWRPLYVKVVSAHPDPVDEEKRFGSAAPLIAEWRRLRDEFRSHSPGLERLRAEDAVLEMEILLIRGCKLTLPPADFPWDKFDLEDEALRRERRLAVSRVLRRRAELRRWFKRVFTLGLWRG